jgi:hypothetical protein
MIVTIRKGRSFVRGFAIVSGLLFATVLSALGQTPPANPINLHARTLSASRIRVSWNDISAAGVDRIMIWYRPGHPVDTVSDVSSLSLDSLAPASPTDTFVICGGLNPMTRYYFGAQVFKDGLRSQITTNASANDSTWVTLSTLDSVALASLNLTKEGPSFDTLTNTIRIRWTVNRSAVDSLDIGISYSTVSATADTVVGQAIQSTGNTDSAVVRLHESLLFNTSYYVKLWLRSPGGIWTDPGQSSAGVVKTPSFTWQSITYFTKTIDTVYAFNREIRLINQPGDVSVTANVVRLFVPVSQAVAGFIPVSVGFEFSEKDRGTPFYVGLKIDSIPPGSRFTDIRIYRDSSGVIVSTGNTITYDSTARYVSVLTNNLDFPFVALIDTTANGVRRSPAIVRPFFRVVQTHSGISVLFGGYNRGCVAAEIYSLKGQLVSSFSCPASGAAALTWNYTDGSGRRVTNGLFILKIIAPDKVFKTRVIVSR